MKYVKLNEGIPFDVENFEDKTNKTFPYFQAGKNMHYAQVVVLLFKLLVEIIT
ncbi:hypothetical protein [Streptococcus suis]|uniref:hypothetical protein n=1 Tax=Streptococcus suis TaxID=1307 RepID=UPI001ABE0958|nr:hypothetical protein [Streptococcus suis]